MCRHPFPTWSSRVEAKCLYPGCSTGSIKAHFAAGAAHGAAVLGSESEETTIQVEETPEPPSPRTTAHSLSLFFLHQRDGWIALFYWVGLWPTACLTVASGYRKVSNKAAAENVTALYTQIWFMSPGFRTAATGKVKEEGEAQSDSRLIEWHLLKYSRL